MTTGRPATGPANVTTPGAAARTSEPGAAARSTPRWPAAHGWDGASNRPTTSAGLPSGPSTGHDRSLPPGPCPCSFPPPGPCPPPAADPSVACPTEPGSTVGSRAADVSNAISSIRSPAPRPCPRPRPCPDPCPDGRSAAGGPAPGPTPGAPGRTGPGPGSLRPVTSEPAPAGTPVRAVMGVRLPEQLRPCRPRPDRCGQPAPVDSGRPSDGCTPVRRRPPEGPPVRSAPARSPCRTQPAPQSAPRPEPPLAPAPAPVPASRPRPPSAPVSGAARLLWSRSALGASRTLHTRPGPPGRLRTPRHRWKETAQPPPSARCECRSVRRARRSPDRSGGSGSARSGRQAWPSPGCHGQNRA